MIRSFFAVFFLPLDILDSLNIVVPLLQVFLFCGASRVLLEHVKHRHKGYVFSPSCSRLIVFAVVVVVAAVAGVVVLIVLHFSASGVVLLHQLLPAPIPHPGLEHEQQIPRHERAAHGTDQCAAEDSAEQLQPKTSEQGMRVRVCMPVQLLVCLFVFVHNSLQAFCNIISCVRAVSGLLMLYA